MVEMTHQSLTALGQVVLEDFQALLDTYVTGWLADEYVAAQDWQELRALEADVQRIVTTVEECEVLGKWLLPGYIPAVFSHDRQATGEPFVEAESSRFSRAWRNTGRRNHSNDQPSPDPEQLSQRYREKPASPVPATFQPSQERVPFLQQLARTPATPARAPAPNDTSTSGLASAWGHTGASGEPRDAADSQSSPFFVDRDESSARPGEESATARDGPHREMDGRSGSIRGLQDLAQVLAAEQPREPILSSGSTSAHSAPGLEGAMLVAQGQEKSFASGVGAPLEATQPTAEASPLAEGVFPQPKPDRPLSPTGLLNLVHALGTESRTSHELSAWGLDERGSSMDFDGAREPLRTSSVSEAPSFTFAGGLVERAAMLEAQQDELAGTDLVQAGRAQRPRQEGQHLPTMPASETHDLTQDKAGLPRELTFSGDRVMADRLAPETVLETEEYPSPAVQYEQPARSLLPAQAVTSYTGFATSRPAVSPISPRALVAFSSAEGNGSEPHTTQVDNQGIGTRDEHEIDLDLILETFAQEIEHAYHRFYGS